MNSIIRATQLSLWALATLLTACGGGGPAPHPNSYEGSWYQAELDIYLVIDADHQAAVRKCSSTGYKTTDQGSGHISGDSLVFPDGTAPMSRNGDILAVDGLDFVLASAPPTVCSGNYVEITSVTPTSTEAGSPSLFTVNFDYQLTTQSKGIIELGFNTMAADTVELELASLPVNQGNGNGALQATISTIQYPDPDHFEVSVFLSETNHLDTWTPLGSDVKPIEVTPPVVTALIKALQNNDLSKYACKHLAWKTSCSSNHQ